MAYFNFILFSLLVSQSNSFIYHIHNDLSILDYNSLLEYNNDSIISNCFKLKYNNKICLDYYDYIYDLITGDDDVKTKLKISSLSENILERISTFIFQISYMRNIDIRYDFDNFITIIENMKLENLSLNFIKHINKIYIYYYINEEKKEDTNINDFIMMIKKYVNINKNKTEIYSIILKTFNILRNNSLNNRKIINILDNFILEISYNENNLNPYVINIPPEDLYQFKGYINYFIPNELNYHLTFDNYYISFNEETYYNIIKNKIQSYEKKFIEFIKIFKLENKYNKNYTTYISFFNSISEINDYNRRNNLNHLKAIVGNNNFFYSYLTYDNSETEIISLFLYKYLKTPIPPKFFKNIVSYIIKKDDNDNVVFEQALLNNIENFKSILNNDKIYFNHKKILYSIKSIYSYKKMYSILNVVIIMFAVIILSFLLIFLIKIYNFKRSDDLEFAFYRMDRIPIYVKKNTFLFKEDGIYLLNGKKIISGIPKCIYIFDNGIYYDMDLNQQINCIDINNDINKRIILDDGVLTVDIRKEKDILISYNTSIYCIKHKKYIIYRKSDNKIVLIYSNVISPKVELIENNYGYIRIGKDLFKDDHIVISGIF